MTMNSSIVLVNLHEGDVDKQFRFESPQQIADSIIYNYSTCYENTGYHFHIHNIEQYDNQLWLDVSYGEDYIYLDVFTLPSINTATYVRARIENVISDSI